MASFSESDFNELAAWLMRRDQGIFDIVELEGFLTALVIGPNPIPPQRWLPKVWGGAEPKFEDLTELNRFMALVMGYHNEILGEFERSPESFEPTFYETEVEAERVIIVDEWCSGFLKAMRLDAPGWKTIKRERPDLIRPLRAGANWKLAAMPPCMPTGHRASRQQCEPFMRTGCLTGSRQRRRQKMCVDTDCGRG